MKILRSAVSVCVVALYAACSSGTGSGGGGGNGVISLSSYDTSCQQASDCTAVAVGSLGCCDCPNAAINGSDLAKYQADANAARGQCNLLCGACPLTASICAQGTCDLLQTKIPCGSTPCTGSQVCVMNQLEGGAQLPADGGVCPAGDHDVNGVCQPLPTYHCAPLPATCAAGLSCGCAQSLCDSGYTCQSASLGTLQCVLMAP
jgi:hypothetical protein